MSLLINGKDTAGIKHQILTDSNGSLSTVYAKRAKDVMGRLKVSNHQNIYEADFEYSKQPLRWEEFTLSGGTVTHMPGYGGVKMSLPTTSGATTIRQSRPYHRYQPGKAMFMATAVNFGSTQANQIQRVGFFDDANGLYFKQEGAATATNPYGMSVGYRSDVNGVPFDTVIDFTNWTDPNNIKSALVWTNIQMLWIEYAWYGAGALRWGVLIGGETYILHEVGVGNLTGQVNPWARTGNLPVRYEQRNTGTTAATNDMYHYGVSVIVEGKKDEQRGFTYSYGMAPASPRRSVTSGSTRYPVLSIQARTMGTVEYTQATAACTAGTTTSLTAGSASWTVDQWKGRCVSYVVSGTSYMARITGNTATVLTIADVVTGLAQSTAPVSGGNYTIGQINRGQLLPQTLLVSSDALCVIELIASTPTSPIVLTNSSFVALSSLGSANSFATRDISSTALTGGEVVYAFTAPSGGSGLLTIDLSNFFPLYNTIKGNAPDILTVAVTTQSGTAANVGAHLICQEAMS